MNSTRLWTGHTSDTRRNTLALRNGTLYGGTRCTPYGQCSRSFADKGKECPNINDYDAAKDKAAARLSEGDKSRIAHLVSKPANKRRNRG